MISCVWPRRLSKLHCPFETALDGRRGVKSYRIASGGKLDWGVDLNLLLHAHTLSWGWLGVTWTLVGLDARDGGAGVRLSGGEGL